MKLLRLIPLGAAMMLFASTASLAEDEPASLVALGDFREVPIWPEGSDILRAKNQDTHKPRSASRAVHFQLAVGSAARKVISVSAHRPHVHPDIGGINIERILVDLIEASSKARH